MILIEENFNNIDYPIEEGDSGKKLYMKGVFMEAGDKNRNGRTYSLDEMRREVDKINTASQKGNHVLGELDHNGSLEVKLQNASHKITEMWMEGNQAFGKAEVLEKTTNGQILKGLIESDVKVGMSSRASGKVNNSGQVENFNLVTIDAVATPSAYNAYPESIYESLELYKNGHIVRELAEAVVEDEKLQEQFRKEMKDFINSLRSK